MQETPCTLKFGERAQKVETQMTPASYRDRFVELSANVSDHERGSSDGVTSVRINKKWAASLGEIFRVAEAELRVASAQVNAEVEKIQSDSKAEKDTLKAALESEKRRIENQSLAEIESLKSANASVLKEIEDKVADVERQLRDKQAKEVKTLSDTLAKLKAKATKLQTKLDSSNADDGPDFKEIAGKKMASLRDQIKLAKRKLKGCRESAFAQLPLHELIDRADELKLIRAKLRAKKKRLLGRAEQRRGSAYDVPPSAASGRLAEVQARALAELKRKNRLLNERLAKFLHQAPDTTRSPQGLEGLPTGVLAARIRQLESALQLECASREEAELQLEAHKALVGKLTQQLQVLTGQGRLR